MNKEALVLLMDSKRAFFYKQALNKKITKLDYELKAKPVRTDQSSMKSLGRSFERHGTTKAYNRAAH